MAVHPDDHARSDHPRTLHDVETDAVQTETHDFPTGLDLAVSVTAPMPVVMSHPI
jgi:hypothetical protein